VEEGKPNVNRSLSQHFNLTLSSLLWTIVGRVRWSPEIRSAYLMFMFINNFNSCQIKVYVRVAWWMKLKCLVFNGWLIGESQGRVYVKVTCSRSLILRTQSMPIDEIYSASGITGHLIRKHKTKKRKTFH